MKLTTLVSVAGGLAVGYLLGAAAGQGRYRQIKHTATDLVRHPRVQQTMFDLAEQAKANSERLPRPAAGFVATATTRLQEALTQPVDSIDPQTGANDLT